MLTVFRYRCLALLIVLMAASVASAQEPVELTLLWWVGDASPEEIASSNFSRRPTRTSK